MKKPIILSLVALLLLVSSNFDVSNAAITSGKYDGGYWIRGVSGISLQSKYTTYRPYALGHASTIDGRGEYKTGGWKIRYVQSNGSQYTSKFSGNRAYYNWRKR